LVEIAGVTHWWMPYLGFKLRGDMPIDREGAIFDATINPTSRMNAKFSAKVTKIVEAKLIEEEIAGDFVGTGDGHLSQQMERRRCKLFNVKTNGLLFSLFSPFVDFGKRHSDVMQKGFKALNSYLSKK